MQASLSASLQGAGRHRANDVVQHAMGPRLREGDVVACKPGMACATVVWRWMRWRGDASRKTGKMHMWSG